MCTYVLHYFTISGHTILCFILFDVQFAQHSRVTVTVIVTVTATVTVTVNVIVTVTVNVTVTVSYLSISATCR